MYADGTDITAGLDVDKIAALDAVEAGEPEAVVDHLSRQVTAAEAALVGNSIMDLAVEREVCSEPPGVLVPGLADVEVVGAAPPSGG